MLHYLVPRSSEQQLTGFLAALEQQSADLGISDLQCSLASLEEVFLTIARQVGGGNNGQSSGVVALFSFTWQRCHKVFAGFCQVAQTLSQSILAFR